MLATLPSLNSGVVRRDAAWSWEGAGLHSEEGELPDCLYDYTFTLLGELWSQCQLWNYGHLVAT